MTPTKYLLFGAIICLAFVVITSAALKGKCPLDITLPDGCPATDCKCTYDEWLACPQNPIRIVKV